MKNVTINISFHIKILVLNLAKVKSWQGFERALGIPSCSGGEAVTAAEKQNPAVQRALP